LVVMGGKKTGQNVVGGGGEKKQLNKAKGYGSTQGHQGQNTMRVYHAGMWEKNGGI